MINQPAESRFAASLKPFFDSIDPQRTWFGNRHPPQWSKATVVPQLPVVMAAAPDIVGVSRS
jgi:hypothetical protein